MEAPNLKMSIEPNEVLDVNDPKFRATKVDLHAPWRLVIEYPGEGQSSTPCRTLRDARIAGGQRAEALGWTVVWEPVGRSGMFRTYRARWVAPVRDWEAEDLAGDLEA